MAEGRTSEAPIVIQDDDEANQPAKRAAEVIVIDDADDDPAAKRRRTADDDDASLALARELQSQDDARAREPLPARGGAACAVCLCDVEPGDGLRLRACGHELHRECAERLVAASDRDGAQCPDCRTPLADLDLRGVGGSSAAERATRFSLDRAVDANPDLHRCPTPDCGFVCTWTPADGPPRLSCGRCNKTSCLCCGKPWHEGSCEDAAAAGDDEEAARRTRDYLRTAGIRRCARCGAGVVKASGCDKMRCLCGYEFCYVCLAPGARCGCTPSHHLFFDNKTGRPVTPARRWRR